ncbi:TonB-dependent receptor [Tsuneonella sp. YG55]|uniref:TonB-dependent receptor n=1 Tax=Tsuneonella litorea TaxID=2976475 RepID=A0A9X2W016_9SPHN|nr:TonB-dependent receptor [Tsuneonella litorea]MCT2557380.1 TonB-dependent receptor [Tsuneonella litorea]
MIRRHTRSAFRRHFALSTASGLALVACAAQPAWAQDSQAPATDDAAQAEDDNAIVVTGFRASLQNAQNIKENADTFVDVITAEDIGALPDRSVAEALQRVPGVNIGRFEKPSDPDRFSVEGTGVIIRGLPYVRSELNGREIFSANGGRELSFNDVSPELLGRVEVFKNVTADMIEGAIAGTVNLVTRKPLDRSGTHIAGSVEMNYGDLRKEWSPTFNLLGSTVFETEGGRIGVQLGYSNSELKSRTDASQIGDPCYRAPTLTGDCIRALSVGSGGFTGNPNFNETNFPPAGSVLVPQYAGVRTTTLDREREAWNASLQYESPSGDFVMSFDWLRSETNFATEEYALLGRRDDPNAPIIEAADTWQYDENGRFISGVLTAGRGNAYATPFGRGGIPLDSLRFLRDATSITSDYSFDVKWNVTDRLKVNFEAQRVVSDLARDSVFGAMSTWADIAIDMSGKTPDIQFLAPPGSPADYFSSGFYTYYWFGLDSREKNEGDMDTLRFDAEYDLGEGFIKSLRVGGRWSNRDRTTRNTDFSTWGNLSAPWAGRAGCAPWNQTIFGAPCGFQPGRFYTGLPGQEFAIAGGAFTDEFPAYSQLRNPFGSNFQRGAATTPIPNGAAWFFGGDDFLGEYLAGITDRQWNEIVDFSETPEQFNLGVNGRTTTDPITGAPVPCNIEGVYCPGEVSTVTEITKAAYGRLDFGSTFGNGWTLEGNLGVRFVETSVKSGGRIGFPNPARFDAVANGGNGDGVVSVAEINANCAGPGAPNIVRGYCDLSAARKAEFAAAHTGEILIENENIKFQHWLPSFNAKLDVGGGLLFRFAVSKGISRPDLQLFRTGGVIGDNTAALKQANTLETGPLFILSTGNRRLRPVTSWNYDVSAEWYFSSVGSLTGSFFIKDIKGRVDTAFENRTYTSPDGTSVDFVFKGPSNVQDGVLKGFELAYQQTYDFLPGLLSGLGTQITYTYVDGSNLSNPNLANPGEPSVTTGGNELGGGAFAFRQPFQGLSKHTVNATVFYEKGPLAMRAAYNWRSAFLITPRDDIYPFSPIWQESGGQLDASIFYAVNKNLKVGVQGVNLLDEVTRTSQVVDFAGTRFLRSAFRNDRRYTFIARFTY